MATPFKPDGSLDTDTAARLATHLWTQAATVWCSRAPPVSRRRPPMTRSSTLLRTVLEAVGDRARIIAGAGTYDTAHSVHLAKACAAEGAHGLLVVTPYYSRPPQAGLVAHFTAVADATACRWCSTTSREIVVPIEWAPSGRWPSTEHRGGQGRQGRSARRRADHRRDRAGVLLGDDALNLPWLAMGAVGLRQRMGTRGRRSAARHVVRLQLRRCGDGAQDQRHTRAAQ